MNYLLKHAHARVTTINIQQKEQILHFSYYDNGKSVNNLKKESGLKNIENRVTLMKGKINYITSNGFKVKIEITPIKKPQIKFMRFFSKR